MCGIAGVSLKSGEPSQPLLERMAALLAHRGPDGEGFYRHRQTALVHRRLSILDLEGGAQPIAAEDGATHIVANGEIYNYRALQARIREWGVGLMTNSDSEVPLHCWRRYGIDFVKYLEGMYALAIYDEASEELILARDPVGIKPLYIAETAAGIAFASEAGALVRAGWVSAEVEEEAWPSFFSKQYVGGALTMFKGVRRVEPGEVLRIRRGTIVDRRIYPLELTRARRMDEDEALAMFDEIATEVVQSHLQSDVPYGAFLSGGTDSSCVVTKMAELVGKVRTYAIGFSSDTVADERQNALRLANKLDTDHSAIEFTHADFWKILPEMCEAMDDLVADYAALPTLKLAGLARQGVKVILSGEGGDEGLAGYGYYRLQRRRGLRAMMRGRFRFQRAADTAGFQGLFRSPMPAWRDRPIDERYDARGFSYLQRQQAGDIQEWLPDDLMTKVDRCLMAHGVEGRVPLLDRKFLGFVFGLPDRLKISDGHHKYLLRRWLADRQPQQEPWARKKGFTVPIQAWLEARRSEILKYLHPHQGVREVIRHEPLKDWLEQPLDTRGAKLLFNVLSYALWHDLYIQSTSLPEALLHPSKEELSLAWA